MISRLKISIEGRNPEHFLKKIIYQGIKIYSLDKQVRKLIIIIDEVEYEKLLDIKTIYSIKIIERYGIIKYKYLMRKYFLFLLFFFIGIMIVIFLSNVIFNVEIIHSNMEIKELVKKDLEKYGIKKFQFKVSFEEKEQIKKKILEKEKDNLEWLEIEEVGTKYIVKIEQRKKNKDGEVCSPRNIVANKQAMILEIEADAGEVIKKKLDYVSKGDVLISGLIYNKEEIVAKRCAIGRVFGEVWYKVEVELPNKYHEENVTGEKMRQVEIQFLNGNYKLFHTFDTYQKNVWSILESRLLPLKIQIGMYLKTDVIDKKYTYNNVDEDAIILAEKKLKDKLRGDSVVLSKKVLKKRMKDSRIIVEVFFRVKEDITEYQDITELNIEELNKKEE